MNPFTTRASLAAVTALSVSAGVAVAQQFVNTRAGTVPADASPVDSDVPLRLLGGGVHHSGAAGSEAFVEPALWDNGPDDRVVAYLSTVNAHVESRVADDCWLKEGMFYDCEYIVVRMAVTIGFLPNTQLYVYPDCDGKPDMSVMPEVIPQEAIRPIEAPVSGDLVGLRIYDIFYPVDRFHQGEDLVWLSPVHDDVDRDGNPHTIEGGYAYWMSANNGTIQGRQTHVNAPAFGLPEWSPAADELCCGICTDMYMVVEGKCCWRVLDQNDPQLDVGGGLFDPVLSQNAPWNRSFDDFQLADPCKHLEEWSICRIEATVATNCDVTTLYAEIYDNVCDMPENSPDAALYKFAPTEVIDTGEVIDGLPVYTLVFSCPDGVILGSDRNYWLTVFSEQGFAAGKRTVWFFENRMTCGIRLNEAKYRNAPIGFDMPTPVSDPALHDAPRDHAVSIWVCDPQTTTTTGDEG